MGPAGAAIVSRVRVDAWGKPLYVAVIIVEPAVNGVIVVVPLVVVAVATEEALDVIITFVYVFETVNAGVVV